jgi:hypothetical protein
MKDVEMMSRIPLEAKSLGLGQSVQHAETFLQGLALTIENRVIIEKARMEHQEENLFEEALNTIRNIQYLEDNQLHFDFSYLAVKE